MNIYLTEYKSYDGLIYAGPEIEARTEIEARNKTFLQKYWMYPSLKVVGRSCVFEDGEKPKGESIKPGEA